MLHISERLCKSSRGMLQASGTLAKQVIGGRIERVTEEQRANIYRFASGRILATRKHGNQGLNMFLKDLRVNETLSREHWPNEMARTRPHLPIGHEDAVAQKLLPFIMKRLALSIVGKFAGENGLDILWVFGEENPG